MESCSAEGNKLLTY